VPPHQIRIGGRATWWEGCIAPVPMEGGTGLLVTAREITERGELQALLDAVPAAVFITHDPDARQMEANRFCAELLRQPAGTNVSKTAPEGERASGFRAMRGRVEIPAPDLPVQRAARLGEEVRDYEFDLVFDDGTVRHLVGNAAPLRGAGGEPAGAVGTFVEITDRVRFEARLRESEERFRVLAEAMPQIVCALRWDGVVEYVNPEWIAYSGLDLAATNAAGWARLVHPDDVGAATATRQRAIAARAPQDVELRYRAADGSYRWFLSRLAPVEDGRGRIARFVGAAMDIDDRRRAEAERERLLADVQAGDRRKNEFLATLSHELRNPLAPIRNGVYLLQRAAPGSETAARAVQVIDRQTRQLARLVDDLLDLTRISRGKIELHPEVLDLRDVVRRTCEDHRASFDAAGVALRYDVSARAAWVDADAARMAQVLSNLLQNAAKFTPAGGSVTVSVDVEGGRATLRVRDTGVGIDPAWLERMFEPFVQAEGGASRTRGGLGLGLALVRGLVERQGGTVAAHSEGKDRGAELVVSFPLVAAPALAAGAPEARPVDGRVVLVVEDDPDAGDTLAAVLSMRGHQVRVARDGRTGIALARELRPDVVLCDIGLPDVDGHEVARTLRADPALAAVRLVALSGYAFPEDRESSARAGFDEHLPKPPPLDRLAELLER
jgi:PAS domain S-box-containing protein